MVSRRSFDLFFDGHSYCLFFFVVGTSGSHMAVQIFFHNFGIHGTCGLSCMGSSNTFSLAAGLIKNFEVGGACVACLRTHF